MYRGPWHGAERAYVVYCDSIAEPSCLPQTVVRDMGLNSHR